MSEAFVYETLNTRRSDSIMQKCMAVLGSVTMGLGIAPSASANEYPEAASELTRAESVLPYPAVPAGSITSITVEGVSQLTAVVNITATESEAAGYVQAKREVDAIGAFSSLNLDKPHQTRASLAFPHLSLDGTFELFNQSTTHLIADVQGYFTEGTVDDIPDQRLFDTRVTHTQPLSSGSIIEFHGRPNTTAIINFFADDVRRAGYMQVLPDCDATPGAYSTMNVDEVGQTVNNPAFVRFDAEGKACAYAQASAHWGADLTAYLNPAAFDDIEDVRLVDTRKGMSKPAQGSLITIHGRPNSTGIISIVATDTEGAGYVQAVGSSDTVGATSNLNVDRAGQTRAALAFVRFDDQGSAAIFTQQSTHIVADLQGYMMAGSFIDTADVRAFDSREDARPQHVSDTLLTSSGPAPVQDSQFEPSCVTTLNTKNGAVVQQIDFKVSGLKPTTEYTPSANGDVATVETKTKLPNGLVYDFFDSSVANLNGSADLQRISVMPNLATGLSFVADDVEVRVSHPNAGQSVSHFSVSATCAIEYL